jgi:putative ABC transport system substrate-binding protein
MKRRQLLSLIGGAAAAWPLSARAQRPVKIARVGIIDDAPIWDHFRQGLREAGYVEGQNLAIEYRSADGQPDRLAGAARELAATPVDVIAVSGTAAARAAQQATTTIPIVMIAIGDPIRAGLVPNLARPGANTTGNTILGAERQTAASLQGVDSSALPCGFPMEFKQWLTSSLSGRVARAGAEIGPASHIRRREQRQPV